MTSDAQKQKNMRATIDRLRGELDSPRERLIAQLAAVFGDERASAVVDALDGYLAEDQDRAPGFAYLPPSTDNLIAERDAAVARAEKAELELQAISDRRKRKR